MGTTAPGAVAGGVAVEGFSSPRAVGDAFLSTPVCMDALGETWAGYITEGIDRGRMVLVTIVPAVPRSRAVEEILAAARATLTVRHPEVLAFLSAEDHRDELSLTSEYLDGEPLTTLLAASSQKATPFQQGVALRIVSDAIRAIDALRAVGEEVAPGGICPEIIYLPSYGELLLRHPRLSGVAMRQLNFRRHPAALPYRAPEQLRNPRLIDETADVFSLGVLLWEMLAMRPLFSDENHFFFGQCRSFDALSPQDIERRIRAMPVPDLMRVQRPGATLHPDVVALTNRCLLRDPSKRFPSISALQAALSALPAGLVSDTRAVASTVERLGGELIRKRQQQMAQLAPMPLRSSAPPSGRASHFPDESAQVTISLPRRIDDQRLKDLMRQADLREELPPSTEDPWSVEDARGSEPPTRPQGPVPSSPQKARTAEEPGKEARPTNERSPHPPPRQAPSGPPIRQPGRRPVRPRPPAVVTSAAPLPASVPVLELTPWSSQGQEGASAGPPPALELPPIQERTGSWRAAAVVALLLCCGAAGLWWSFGRSRNDSLAGPANHHAGDTGHPNPRDRDNAGTGGPPDREAPDAPTVEDGVEDARPGDGATERSPGEAEPPSESPAPDDKTRPTATPHARPISRKTPQRDPRAAKPKVAPSSGAAEEKKSDGAFRPEGI